ncbi:tRNA uridine-5-carboxymethylaminomethyl(34) synthesis GTPase MnmE [Swingsia samuiensis]|uniref:tRNA modification GTPase MnmE n=1 Tax=Swingsia samuiensis TaxID=1293412 RepID=A0A4Y6UKA3_9PROT|nr:tRNA uridine-5-carboxymethylaminomethyl(34) synthesis GTPase MnmE [Swingsia samuiensis]QDH16906.1 tRNA uridine-5-carboxymethylaminomethyl(34) synthesis GTPase MnmE [Swingsia samuiensis]
MITASSSQTIFALATGAGRAAIAIIRVSGAESGQILKTLIRGSLTPKRASLKKIIHHDEVLDHAVVLWLPGPNSYTGEDGFELHLHAGPAIIARVADALTDLGARPAEPGEFTKRAVQKGRMDLIQAEAIADLVDSETESQRKQALEQANGALSNLYNSWAERLRLVLANQEALIDFPDEDLPPEVEDALRAEIDALHHEMSEHLTDQRGELMRQGLTVVIAGSPNVGKSSLLNSLSGYDAAIVTHRAGTTRDAIAVDWVLEGVRVRLIDTAGLRETEDEIEAEGIRRALFHVKQADIVLHLIGPDEELTSLSSEEVAIRTKIDLSPAPENMLGISTETGLGLKELRNLLKEKISSLMAGSGTPPLTRARHRAGIQESVVHLERAQKATWPELRGEELRLSMHALGRLTGHVDVESLLDAIFGQFCIGK